MDENTMASKHVKSQLTIKNVAIFAGAITVYLLFLFWCETNLTRSYPLPSYDFDNLFVEEVGK